MTVFGKRERTGHFKATPEKAIWLKVRPRQHTQRVNKMESELSRMKYDTMMEEDLLHQATKANHEIGPWNDQTPKVLQSGYQEQAYSPFMPRKGSIGSEAHSKLSQQRDQISAFEKLKRIMDYKPYTNEPASVFQSPVIYGTHDSRQQRQSISSVGKYNKELIQPRIKEAQNNRSQLKGTASERNGHQRIKTQVVKSSEYVDKDSTLPMKKYMRVKHVSLANNLLIVGTSPKRSNHRKVSQEIQAQPQQTEQIDGLLSSAVTFKNLFASLEPNLMQNEKIRQSQEHIKQLETHQPDGAKIIPQSKSSFITSRRLMSRFIKRPVQINQCQGITSQEHLGSSLTQQALASHQISESIRNLSFQKSNAHLKEVAERFLNRTQISLSKQAGRSQTPAPVRRGLV